MIIERLAFRAKFGQGDSVVEAFKQWRDKFGPQFNVQSRLMVDVTGQMFNVVVENEYRDFDHVAEMEKQQQESFGDPAFQEWFGSWSQLVETGSRDFFRVIE
jgi:hypothetical protein